ncbi:MAG: DUF4389 domain-containing protein [Gammaproteobacteria bacterium]|nr:DUF4389 domain-containing protein [Gammaproteobacteria bacterium]MDD2928440.1 DUF4389 domain-containing protein [Sideroxydans sp.]MDD5471842.1 DUF4389 domain-containing protein [Sideroxydans sp.]
MNRITESSGHKRNIWMRGLFMLLMGLAFQVCGTVLCIVTVIQFAVVVLGGEPNVRLLSFGRNLGTYLRQIVAYLTFAAEELPFPFSEWPTSGE